MLHAGVSRDISDLKLVAIAWPPADVNAVWHDVRFWPKAELSVISRLLSKPSKWWACNVVTRDLRKEWRTREDSNL